MDANEATDSWETEATRTLAEAIQQYSSNTMHALANTATDTIMGDENHHLKRKATDWFFAIPTTPVCPGCVFTEEEDLRYFLDARPSYDRKLCQVFESCRDAEAYAASREGWVTSSLDDDL